MNPHRLCWYGFPTDVARRATTPRGAASPSANGPSHRRTDGRTDFNLEMPGMNASPPPAPTPPSIESAVQEHLNVVHEVRELRRQVTQLTLDVGRAIDVATTAHLLLTRLAKHLGMPNG